MKQNLFTLLAVVALLAGCSAAGTGTPRAVAPETQFDFGDVPVTAPVKNHDFVIKNEGTGDLKITGAKVKLLQGC